MMDYPQPREIERMEKDLQTPIELFEQLLKS
jgi:hypothetical protein